MGELTVRNGNIRASVDEHSGALSSVVMDDWVISDVFRSASFVLLVPTTEKRAVWIHGVEQEATVHETPDGVMLEWSDPVDTLGKTVPITIDASIKKGELGFEFDMKIHNRSDRTVEAVRWPIISSISPPTADGRIVRRQFDGAGFQDLELYPTFPDNQGYWGTYLPTESAGASNLGLFQLVDCDGRGLYLGCHDSEYRYLAKWVYELAGGYVDSYKRVSEPGNIDLSLHHFPFITSGDVVNLSPVVMAGYDGGWQAGADVYRQWRSQWHKRPELPAWVKDPHAWLQIQIYGAEDVVNFRYAELPEVARQCKEAGIKAIQLTGWAFGGQDRGNPRHDVDPALGTFDDLRTAIAECRDMGIEVVLFCKWTWVDQSQPHVVEMEHFLARNAYGYPYPAGGYSYYTETQLARINTCPLIPTCTASPAWRQHGAEEFRKVLSLKPSGILFDEGQHHGSAQYCFSPDHGHPVPAFLYGYDVELAQAFKKELDTDQPGFLFSGEHLNDGEMTEYHLSYTRFTEGHVPVYRYVAPEAELMMAVTGQNDRNRINECLKYRYIFSYEPRNFKGRPGEIPKTVGYGRSVDELRKRYRDILWDGRYIGPCEAAVSVNGYETRDFACFVSSDGRRGFVYANLKDSETEEVMISVIGDVRGDLMIVTPGEPEPTPLEGAVAVQPQSVVVVIEIEN